MKQINSNIGKKLFFCQSDKHVKNVEHIKRKKIFSLKNDLHYQKWYLKGVVAKNERGYRLNAIKKRF